MSKTPHSISTTEDSENLSRPNLNKPKHDRRYSYLMMIAHLCDDLNQGALVAVIPFLVLHNGYSYAEVTALLLASNAASAIIQPLFGWLGDKKPRPWLMAAGIFLAGIGMGVLPNYPLIMASAMLSGIGVAMFHPEGGRLGNLTAGEQKGKGMSIFAVGGKLGFTFGPLVATAAITLWGLPGTLIFIIPSTLCAAILLSQNKALLSYSNPDKQSSDESLYQDNWVGFGFVMGAISCRSIMYYAFLSFIPLFLVYNLGQEEAFASSVISLFALVCAVGTIASGWAGQLLGAKRLIIVSYLCLQWFAYRSTHSHCVSCSYLRHFLSFGSRNGTELCSSSLRNGIRPVIWRYGLHWWINDSRFWPHRRLFWTSGRHALCYRNCPFGNHYYPFHPKEQTDEISVSAYRSEIVNLRDTANLPP